LRMQAGNEDAAEQGGEHDGATQMFHEVEPNIH
jgi:hypothetical protein